MAVHAALLACTMDKSLDFGRFPPTDKPPTEKGTAHETCDRILRESMALEAHRNAHLPYIWSTQMLPGCLCSDSKREPHGLLCCLEAPAKCCPRMLMEDFSMTMQLVLCSEQSPWGEASHQQLLFYQSHLFDSQKHNYSQGLRAVVAL